MYYKKAGGVPAPLPLAAVLIITSAAAAVSLVFAELRAFSLRPV